MGVDGWKILLILVAMLDRTASSMQRAPARPAGHARIQRMLLAVALALAVTSVAAPDADHQCIGRGRLAAADRTCVAVQVCAKSCPLCARMASEESLTRFRDPHLPQQTPAPPNRHPGAKLTRCSASPRRSSQRGRMFPLDGLRRHLNPKTKTRNPKPYADIISRPRCRTGARPPCKLLFCASAMRPHWTALEICQSSDPGRARRSCSGIALCGVDAGDCTV